MHRAADDFLRHLRFGRGRAEGTTTYATSVSLYLLWCGQVHRDWWDAVDRLGAFMLWLRHAEGPAAGAGISSPGLVVRQAGRINAVLVAVREFLKHAVAAGEAPARVLSALYEISDDRWLPADLRGERNGLRFVARPRHRLSVPASVGEVQRRRRARVAARMPVGAGPVHRGAARPGRPTAG
ncbi:hypothetical protein [Kribbella sp. NPDC051718]|uniref:hypothetical protein n=1 Tax=Kribbella sp. NPDC051718 TaxID=3155168 RepID=UPI003423C8AA